MKKNDEPPHRVREVSGLHALSDETTPDLERVQYIRTRLTWLLFFRGVVLSALLASAILVNIGEGADFFGPSLVAIYATCAAGFAVILAGGLWLRRPNASHMHAMAYVQLVWDSIVAGTLALLTGGIDSAFIFLFFLTVLNAAAVLGRKATFILAAINFGLYVAVLGLQSAGVVASLGVMPPERLSDVIRPLLINNLGMFLIAALAGYLTGQIARASERLSETRAQLVQVEELYAAVLGSVPSGILTIDGGGRVLYVNQAGAEIFGAAPAELIGEPFGPLVPELDVDSTPSGQRFEAGIGGARVIGGSVAELTGLQELAGRVIVFQDLTELRQLQHDVARADRLATIGRFAAGLAHEIRNPLAAMVGCLQLLQADARADDDEERMLRIVQREAERLDDLVSEFLMFARPAPPEKGSVDIGALIDETVVAMTAQDGVDVEVRTERLMLDCDGARIRQVLWNLLGNAVAAGGPGTRIRVSTTVKDGRVRVVVEDSGPGVPEENRSRIFEPFFTTRPRGTGLGLAVCHQIVQSHGGRLRVMSSVDLGGARFEMVLPLDASMPVDDAGMSGEWAQIDASA